VYGFSLIYSGNHSTVAKIDQFGGLRIQQGINPYQFKWELKPNEKFYTPQSVICYSDSGFGAMSREYHDVYRNNLMRSKWTHKNRPLLINNWEGTYFDFTEEKLLAIAKKAKEVGLDLFVLDDGWFGKRNNDMCSLGDWVVNQEKLPSGIDGLAEKINNLGLKFGLWFEPEMVNPDSDLYRKHPDWAVKVSERTPIEIRNQLVLDLSRDDVCEYIIEAVSNILRTANVEYVKWDMNRQITDMPYLGYNHRYTLGYYRIMSTITSSFPNVLFEGCSAGGGRFDAGVLAYMPQIWTSDNSDAVSRLKIQYSTSMCYPVSSISTHITASPNHQCGRVTSLKTRGDVAYAGTFGYELDITKSSEKEIDEIKKQIEFDKSIQTLIREGDLYRIESPYETNYCSWEIVSKDKKQVFLFACKILTVAMTKNPRVKLRGLDPNKKYRSTSTGKIYGGDMLMYRGIKINYKNADFATEAMCFEMI
jgi:alpha-galactosidase